MNKYLFFILTLVFISPAGCGKNSSAAVSQALAKPSAAGGQEPKISLPAFHAKGIHVSAWVACTNWWFNDIVALTNTSELNALVIDCKDETGYISWNSRVKLAQESGACSDIRIKDIKSLMEICRKNKIYP